MITISAFKSVPPFAQGHVRDLRARWALEEAGLPYRTRLLEQGDQDGDGAQSPQAYGQHHVRQAPCCLHRALHRQAGFQARARCADRGFQGCGVAGTRSLPETPDTVKLAQNAQA